MAARVFALIIGIDKYKSGNIWNLASAVDDANDIKRWLTRDLHVPRDQICLLLDNKATRRNIEDSFMSHLVNNDAIEKGDAILIYFAGHGSSLVCPRDWYPNRRMGNVCMLCPFDHDTIGSEGRIAGITDRALIAMLADLHQSKGENITVVLDCSFSSSKTESDLRERGRTRWTPTDKSRPDDLFNSLWKRIDGSSTDAVTSHGLFQSHESHILLAACDIGGKAVEGKEGGKFTRTLLEVKGRIPLHGMTYSELVAHLNGAGNDLRAVCYGRHKDRVLFGGAPFVPDIRFFSVDTDTQSKIRIGAGAIHGIVEGSEFSVHKHNRRGSANPALATLCVFEIHPTWSVARVRKEGPWLESKGWALLTRWNNRTPFRVYLRRTCLSLCRRRKLAQKLSARPSRSPSKNSLNVIRVKDPLQADISVALGRRELEIERHDDLIGANCRRVIRLALEKYRDEMDIIEDAVRFGLHLHRQNTHQPFRDAIRLELFRVDSTTWAPVGDNLLLNGKAEIVEEKGAMYQVVVTNHANVDLWPYLALMDSNEYAINMIYHPESGAPPPLRRGSRFAIGSSATSSDALSFSLPNDETAGSAFLKLYLSSEPTRMNFMEQGLVADATKTVADPEQFLSKITATQEEIWDAMSIVVTVTAGVDTGS